MCVCLRPARRPDREEGFILTGFCLSPNPLYIVNSPSVSLCPLQKVRELLKACGETLECDDLNQGKVKCSVGLRTFL